MRAVHVLLGAIKEKRETACSGREAKKSFEIALAAYESHENGMVPISFPLVETTKRVISR